jgi:fascin 1/2
MDVILPHASAFFMYSLITDLQEHAGSKQTTECWHLFVSGVDVTANQDEISDHETFQLEFDVSTKRWYIRTMQDRYWTLETGGGIQACGDKRYFPSVRTEKEYSN